MLLNALAPNEMQIDFFPYLIIVRVLFFFFLKEEISP